MTTKKERVAIVSVLASGSLAVAKFVVGVAIGSLALITDALHSVIDLGATLITWYAVRVADLPPDEKHHYGHGKVESIAALAETALLFLLAGGVVVEAVGRLQAGGSPVAFSFTPFVVLIIDMAVNFWRSRVLHRVAVETKSPALEADSLHFASDFYGSIPVIIGLALAAYGYDWGDAVAALVVALLISILGFRLGRRTIESLVDTAPTGIAESVRQSIQAVPGIVGLDRLRIRTVGPQNFVDAAVRVPRTLPIDALASLKENVHRAVDGVLDRADLTITATPIALDNETVLERVMVIARNRSLAVHHVIVHAVKGRLAVSLDLEVDGQLSLARAHDIATELEIAIQGELGPEVEVETHIEPLQLDARTGEEASPNQIAAMTVALKEVAQGLDLVRDVHDVRVRNTKDGEVVNFHCRVDPSLPVHTVHLQVDEVERGLRRRFPSIRRVIGHAEPAR